MKLTNRGWFVLGVVSTLAFIGAYEIITHLYWVGNGYCWGTFAECYR